VSHYPTESRAVTQTMLPELNAHAMVCRRAGCLRSRPKSAIHLPRNCIAAYRKYGGFAAAAYCA
jgi:hypothetical protein